jgi:hypothetical protein
MEAFKFADVDGDDDLDVLFTGYNTTTFARMTTLWENLLYSPVIARPGNSQFDNGFNFEHVESTFGDGFRMFPNPTNIGYFNLYTSNLVGDVEVRILDTQGRVIFSENMTVRDNKLTINTDNLSKGLYLVNLTQDSNRFIGKLIVE